MATLVTAALPATKFALAETLASVPEAIFEIEGIVETGDGIMPLVWAQAADNDRLDTALRNDTTTETVELLSKHGQRWFYRMEWIDYTRVLVRMLVVNKATILRARTNNDQWVLQLVYPERHDVNKTRTFYEEHNITLGIHSVRGIDTQPVSRYELTDGQYEALKIACEYGYYSVPREVTLEDLAEEFDISHQALSERLRRATDSLVQNTLFIEISADALRF